MAEYLFSVHYSRINLYGKLIDGTTIVSSKRPNLGIPGAQKKLNAMFQESVLTVNRIEPYMSGSDLVKTRRKDKAANV